MHPPIEVRAVARVVDPTPGQPLDVTLTYDPADPLAVRILFSDPASGEGQPWVVERRLLAVGTLGLVGPGDVQVYPYSAPAGVGLDLTGPAGTVSLWLPLAPVEHLLARSYLAVPAGRERVDVDAAVAALLDGATP